MKIAWLHSTFTEGNNGAEKLVYLMAKEFSSKIYTCEYNNRVDGSYPGIKNMLVVDKINHPESFSRMPYEVMKSMTKRQDIDADFLIYSSNLPIFRIRKDNTPYLYFCHTPERGFFDLQKEMMDRIDSWGFPNNLIAKFFFNRRKGMDKSLFMKKVSPENVVTNSKLIMDRYRDAYGKTPRRAVGAPIETHKYSWKEPEDHFFTASGLRWNKRIEWQIKAVARSGHKLKIAGDGPARKDLESVAKREGANVEFLGRVDEKELIDQFSRCMGFIFTAKDEDFGMVPLEAMASGKPVVCVGEGGPLEYLNEKNSFIFKDIEGLVHILKTKSKQDFVNMKTDCMMTSRFFDVKEVGKRIREDIDDLMKNKYT